jgi:hypothetical protein
VPITYVLDRLRHRVTARAVGIVTYPDVLAHLGAKARDHAGGYDELFDATGATTDLTADQVRALVAGAAASRREGRCGAAAIVATNDVAFGMSRMLAILCEVVRVPAEVFRDVVGAEEWLDRLRGAGPPPPA